MTAPGDPVTVVGRWFPADVVLPGRTRPWNRVYVLATDTTLYVWTRAGDVADWSSRLDPLPPVLPANATAARNGFDMRTVDGLVVVTLGSGCRCGSLGRWAGPSWAGAERVRR